MSDCDLKDGKVTKTILNRLGIFSASGAARASISYVRVLDACKEHYGPDVSETMSRRLATRVWNTLGLARTLFTSHNDDELLVRIAELSMEESGPGTVEGFQTLHARSENNDDVPLIAVLQPVLLFPAQASTKGDANTVDSSRLQYKYSVIPLEDVTEPVWKECATLFSEHYGVWRAKGGRVKLNHNKLSKQLLTTATKPVLTSRLITARSSDNVLLGHSFVVLFNDGGRSATVAWITQLVVHTNYRGQGVGKELCRLSWTSGCNIWGLVTSHPYAVRSLERATGRKCNPALIKARAQMLLDNSPVQYIQNCETSFADDTAIINTKFDVDHTEVNIARQKMQNWVLGDLPDGWEYFAFVFDEQSLSQSH